MLSLTYINMHVISNAEQRKCNRTEKDGKKLGFEAFLEDMERRR